jgi:4-hydroxybenzoate polyprenyltransferase
MVRIWGKESYEKAMILPKKVRGFIDLIRPFTMLAPIIGGLCGGLMGWVQFHPFPEFELPFIYLNHKFPFLQYHDGFLELLIGATTLAMLNAASNTLNAVYDADIDKINKPYRPIPSGVITREEARAFAWILYPIVFVRAILVNRTFGLLVLIIMLITVVYCPAKKASVGLQPHHCLCPGAFGFCCGMGHLRGSLFRTNTLDHWRSHDDIPHRGHHFQGLHRYKG